MSHQFLDSDFPDAPEPQFEALGHAGSEHYAGLETFPNPGCHSVTYTSDEIVAYCPITGQPDFYTAQIILLKTDLCIESKSLKLWLRQFNNPTNGLFCEALAVYIRNQVGLVLGYSLGNQVDEEEASQHIQVTLNQKSRGGIEIKAVA